MKICGITIYFIILWSIILIQTQANAIILPKVYKSGYAQCSDRDYPYKNEIPRWVTSYVDAKKADSGTTLVYTWTKKPFDSNKPTLIFLSGGPGNNSHDSYLDLENWNIIFFDQRGISCSRPQTEQIFLDKKFYSSEQIVDDIESIRKSYNLDKISLYGVSYGTVLAHMYGSMYPARAQTIILEGTIFKGGSFLIEPKRRIELLQKFFNSLSVKEQNRILELSQITEVPKNWFSYIGMYFMYLDKPFEKYKQFLNNIIWENDSAFSTINSIVIQEVLTENDFGTSQIVLGMIGCKELGMNLDGVSFYSLFNEKNQLVSDKNNHMKEPYCKSLGFKDGEYHNYMATKYKSIVPTYYIQGTYDGSTVIDHAYLHFMWGTQGHATFLLAENGGHQPLLADLESGYANTETAKIKKSVINKILSQQKMKASELSDLSAVTEIKWKLIEK